MISPGLSAEPSFALIRWIPLRISALPSMNLMVPLFTAAELEQMNMSRAVAAHMAFIDSSSQFFVVRI